MIPVECAGPDDALSCEFLALALVLVVGFIAISGATVAVIAAQESGRRWWVWLPVGAVFPFVSVGIAFLLVQDPVSHLLEPDTVSQPDEFNPGLWRLTRFTIASAMCATWCGYVARGKNRRVWLWVVLGAVFNELALLVVLVWPRHYDSPEDPCAAAADEARFGEWIRRQRQPPGNAS